MEAKIKINLWSGVKSMLPFLIGLLIGAGITRNAYIFYILISIMVFKIGFGFIGKSVASVKEATDKKLAVRNEAVKTINSAVEITEHGTEVGGRMFDKFYSDYVLFLNLCIIIYLLYTLYSKQWLFSLVSFIGLNVFIVLNQIVRKVRHLNNDDYIKKPLNKDLIDEGGKIEN